MLSFAQLWEIVDQEKSPLMSSGEESQAMQVVRAGINLRQDEGASFWDDLIQLCSNAQGVADLLGVKREVVASWASRIRDVLDDIETHDRQTPNEDEEDDQVMPTGDNGAVTVKNMGVSSPGGAV